MGFGRRWRLAVLLAAAVLMAHAAADSGAAQQPVGPYEVRDAVAQFNALKHHGEAVGWQLLESQGAPDPSFADHYQGVVRYPGAGKPVLYVTQLDDDDPVLPGAPDKGGYLLVARMGTRPATGERMRSNLQAIGTNTDATPAPDEDKYLRSIRFDGSLVVDGQALPAYQHPGGMAIVDDVLLMALDQPRASGSPTGQIVLFDLRADREAPQAIQALPLDHKIDNLGAVRQPDGTLLIWVNGDSGHVTRFYSTSSADLRDPDLALSLLKDWDPAAPGAFSSEVNAACESNDWPTGVDAYQGSTFVRQKDGGLFIAMTRNETEAGDGCDIADLHRVDRTGDGGFRLTRVASGHHFCNFFQGSVFPGRICSFIAAASAYVSPSGELMLYSVPHDDQDQFDPDVVRMAEFRHRDVNTEESPLRLPSADAGAPYTVDEGGTVTLTGTGEPRADRPWVELYEHQDFGGRSIVVDYDDRDLLELYNFSNLDGFTDKTTAVRWRAPVGLDVELYEHQDFGGRKVVLKGTGQTESVAHLDALAFNDIASSLGWAGTPSPNTVAFAWDLDNDGAFDDSSSQSPTFGPASDDDVRTVGLRVTDAGGAVSTDSATVTVRNVAPRIESAALKDSLGNPIAAGSNDAIAGLPVKLEVTFSDPGVLDTQSAVVDWGDDTKDTAFDSYTDARSGAVGRLHDSHVFSASGTYEIVVTITDDDGGATEVPITVEVISARDMIEGVANELTALINATTDPNIAAALRAARDDLIGNRGGQPPTNGALDKLEQGDPVAAITKLRAAIAHLAQAEASGAGDLSWLKDRVGLIAEAIARAAYRQAQAVIAPPSPREAAELAAIAVLIEQGHRQLRVGQYLAACDSFRQATGKAVKLAG